MKRTRRIIGVILTLLCFICIPSSSAEAAPRQTVIAIDAGHGGENLGAEYNNMIEKEATLKVAFAMKKELEKYQNVTVVMTRTDDSDISIDQRVKDVSASKPNIIISLHFNMSEFHTQSGNEMWISSREDLYNSGYRFASYEQNLLDDYGIPKRGIYVRLNSLEEDYYGIIRYACKKNIPAVIVEHCYFDNAADEGNYETDTALERLGKIDATAVAMAYRLKSDSLGVDYTKLKDLSVKLPEKMIIDDKTPPSLITASVDDYDEDSGLAEIYVEAYDEESNLKSFRYTLDGGLTFSKPQDWGDEGNVLISVPVSKTEQDIKFRVYVKNTYDLESYSNNINISDIIWGETNGSTTFVYNKEITAMNDIGDDLQTFQVTNNSDELQNNALTSNRLGLLMLTVLPMAGISLLACVWFYKKKIS